MHLINSSTADTPRKEREIESQDNTRAANLYTGSSKSQQRYGQNRQEFPVGSQRYWDIIAKANQRRLVNSGREEAIFARKERGCAGFDPEF